MNLYYLIVGMIFWASLVILVKLYGRKSITLNKQVDQERDIIRDGLLETKTQKIVISYAKEDKGINFDLLCDLCIRYDDLLNGTYKIPEQFLKEKIVGENINPIVHDSSNTSQTAFVSPENQSNIKFVNVVSLIKNVKKDEK